MHTACRSHIPGVFLVLDSRHVHHVQIGHHHHHHFLHHHLNHCVQPFSMPCYFRSLAASSVMLFFKALRPAFAFVVSAPQVLQWMCLSVWFQRLVYLALFVLENLPTKQGIASHLSQHKRLFCLCVHFVYCLLFIVYDHKHWRFAQVPGSKRKR